MRNDHSNFSFIPREEIIERLGGTRHQFFISSVNKVKEESMDHHSTLTFVFPEGAKLAKLSLDKYATG